MNGVTTTVPIAAVEWTKEDNPRDGAADQDRIRELAQSDPSLWPPIVVALQSADKYRGIDGYARCETAKTRLELTNILAVVQEMPVDIRSRAFELNQHGWPLSVRERKAHALYLRQRFPELPAREVARRCGLSPTTVTSTVQNGQPEEATAALDPRRDLAKAALRFIRGFQKLQTTISGTFVINPNRPKSVAAVLREYVSEDKQLVAEIKGECAAVSDFMRDVAHELK